LDIEGTTTPIAFVYDVLFPFVRNHLAGYFEHNREDLTLLKSEHEEDVRAGLHPPPWSGPPVAYVKWLMDRDRKSTGIKQLQGRIWEQGYKQGTLKGQVFPDVPPALRRWQSKGLDVRIFSSGSVLAQQLLFSSTHAGDLTQFLKGYFDTTTGPKADPESYHRIAEAFGFPPPEILFISDVTAELDAARTAGMQTLLCRRPGNAMQHPSGHLTIWNFDEITD